MHNIFIVIANFASSPETVYTLSLKIIRHTCLHYAFNDCCKIILFNLLNNKQ